MLESSFWNKLLPFHSNDVPFLRYTDIDECTEGTHNCHANAQCMNNEGSFTCMCNPGFTGNGTSCQSKMSFVLNEDSIESILN